MSSPVKDSSPLENGATAPSPRIATAPTEDLLSSSHRRGVDSSPHPQHRSWPDDEPFSDNGAKGGSFWSSHPQYPRHDPHPHYRRQQQQQQSRQQWHQAFREEVAAPQQRHYKNDTHNEISSSIPSTTTGRRTESHSLGTQPMFVRGETPTAIHNRNINLKDTSKYHNDNDIGINMQHDNHIVAADAKRSQDNKKTYHDNMNNSDEDDDEDDDDPFDIVSRFVIPHTALFATALQEIQDGRKESHWMWYMFPTPPFLIDGVEAGSSMNRQFALRTDEQAVAFLQYARNDVDLRQNYLDLVQAVLTQLQAGTYVQELFPYGDHKKVMSSLQLFERIGVRLGDQELYTQCQKVLAVIAEQQKQRPKRRSHHHHVNNFFGRRHEKPMSW